MVMNDGHERIYVIEEPKINPYVLESLCSKSPTIAPLYEDVMEILKKEEEALLFRTRMFEDLVIPGIQDRISVESRPNTSRLQYVLANLRKRNLVGCINRHLMYHNFLGQLDFVDGYAAYRHAMEAVSLQMSCADNLEGKINLFYFLNRDQVRRTTRNRLIPRTITGLRRYYSAYQINSALVPFLGEHLVDSIIKGMDLAVIHKIDRRFLTKSTREKRMRLIEAVLETVEE